MVEVTLRRGHIKPLWFGHPWVFRKAIFKVAGEPAGGDVVTLRDPEGKDLGHGWWHPDSAIAVRRLAGFAGDFPAFFEEKLRQAAALRSPQGTYRLLNGEGDGVPGVTIDIFGDVASITLSSLGAWHQRHALVDALETVCDLRAVVLDGGGPKKEGVPSGAHLARGEGDEVQVQWEEGGVRFAQTMPGGQKSGAYLDQRDNRDLIAALAEDAAVLDLYCYQGAFALRAAHAGAREALGVDSSAPAIEAAQGHAKRNGLGQAHFVREDVQRFLKAGPPEGRRYDIIILDPPPMARSRKHADGAAKALVATHKAALPWLKPDGLILSCSCSHHLDHGALERILNEAARAVGRPAQVLERRGAAWDHPVLLPAIEGRYLSAVLAMIR